MRPLDEEKKAESFHHNVYVILLDPKVAKHPSVLRVNRKRDPAKPCLYVGMSGLPPAHRFENHRNGYQVVAAHDLVSRRYALMQKHGRGSAPPATKQLPPKTRLLDVHGSAS